MATGIDMITTNQDEERPVIEVDSHIKAVYVLFNRKSVHRTKVIQSDNETIGIDYSEDGEVVGFELVGAVVSIAK